MNKIKFNYICKVLLLGFYSGFPQVLIGSLFTLWLKSAGYSKSMIGALSMVSFFYAFNWMIAPFVDRYTLFLDRRRFWIILCQIVLFLSAFFAAGIDIQVHLSWVAACVLVMALFSSIHDVAIDALRIELTPKEYPELLSVGSACAVIGWNTSFYLGAALGLYIYEYLHSGAPQQEAWMVWNSIYLIFSFVFLLMTFSTYFVFRRKNVQIKDSLPKQSDTASWVHDVLVRPFSSFITNNGLKMFVILLLFAFLFRIGEAFLGRMALPFYKEMNFTESEIASHVKVVGWLAVTLFSLVIGVLSTKIRVWRGLMIGGIAMAATNLLYAVLAIKGHDTQLLLFTVVVDQFTGAFASIFFVTFISSLCDRKYTATQYALFASIGSAARVFFSGSSGYVLENWLGNDWAVFFVITTAMVIPSLILLWTMRGWIDSKLTKE